MATFGWASQATALNVINATNNDKTYCRILGQLFGDNLGDV